MKRFLYINISRPMKFFFQRLTRGWDDSQTWNLDCRMTEFILPRLIKFKELNKCMPYGMTEEEWDTILGKMILSFILMKGSSDDEDAILNKYYPELETRMEKYLHMDKDINTGLALFAKHFQSLWW